MGREQEKEIRQVSKIDRHIKLDIDKESDYESLENLGKALSSRVRLQILSILKHKSMNLVELSQKLQIPVSSTAFHIRLLEEAHLINTEMQPGIRGSQKVCSSRAEDVFLRIQKFSNERQKKSFHVEMPVGSYYDLEVHPVCGMVNQENYIGSCDDAASFYLPNRSTAQLIWFQRGFIEYRFPSHFLQNQSPNYVSFSLEVCSEAPGYRNVWPSDITFSINGTEILTYTSPGDFGGRHGKVTPVWWTDGNTQYGLLKTISLNQTGCFLDGVRQSNEVTIDTLRLLERPYISFRMEIKEDAKHIGGINIFGKSYGDYPQDIVMYVEY